MTYADRIAAQKDRTAARAERRHEWAESRRRQAGAAFDAAHRLGDAIPLGQPILVGHHSEGRHRRDLTRIDSAMRRGIESEKMADYHEQRAEAAERRIEQMERPDVTLRRMERLRADLRAMERNAERNPNYYAPKIAEIREAIAYWGSHLAALQAEGVHLWGPSDFQRGDVVSGPHGLARVLRVNAKSLSIELLGMANLPECMRRGTLPYSKVTGRAAQPTAH